MVEENLRIGEKWKLPLTRLQIEELDKMVDFYTRLYKPKIKPDCKVVVYEVQGGGKL